MHSSQLIGNDISWIPRVSTMRYEKREKTDVWFIQKKNFSKSYWIFQESRIQAIFEQRII